MGGDLDKIVKGLIIMSIIGVIAIIINIVTVTLLVTR